MVDDSGRLLASELEVWGPPRPLFLHLMHLLALPHCDMVIRVGPNPIGGKDRVSLAGELHTASFEIFYAQQVIPGNQRTGEIQLTCPANFSIYFAAERQARQNFEDKGLP